MSSHAEETELLLSGKKDVPNYTTDELVLPETRILQRSLKFKHAFALILGSLIGSGMFVSPALVAQRSPNMFTAIAIWVSAGGCALLGSLCYSELASIIKKTGSSYIFVFECYGDVMGFVILWSTNLITAPFDISILSLTCGLYACAPFFSDHTSATYIWTSKVVALVALLFTIIVACFGLKASGKVQMLLSAAQFSVIAFIAGLGVYQLIHTGDAPNLRPNVMFNNTLEGLKDVGSLGLAMFNALFAYDGWLFIASFVEEVEKPSRTIPLLSFTVMPLVTLCYVLVNIACLTALTKQEMAISPVVINTFGEKVVGKAMTYIIPILVSICCIGNLNGLFYFLPRSILSSAREGHFPSVFAMIHKKSSAPIPAILFIGFIGCLVTLFSGNIETAMLYFNLSLWIGYGVTISTVIAFRYKYPSKERTYKTWISTPVFMVVLSLALVIASATKAPISAGICLAFMSISFPLYFACVRWNWFAFLKLEKLCLKLSRYTPLVKCVVEDEEDS